MKVVIEAINSPEYWKVGGSTAKLRIEALQGFTTSDGQFIPPSSNGSFYIEVPITILADIPTISSFEIDSTEDATPWGSPVEGDVPGYKATIVTDKGRKFPYLSQFRVPTLTDGDPSYAWGEIRAFNKGAALSALRTRRYITEDEVRNWITTAVGNLNKGSETNTGVVAISKDATDPAFPTAVSVTDPIWLDVIAGRSINVDRGQATLVDGSVTVLSSVVSSNQAPSLAPMFPPSGILYIDNIVNGVSFDIKSTDFGDNGIVGWALFNTV